MTYKRLRLALKRWVAEVCPLKVGDVLPACGYSYKGLPMKITEISSSDWMGRYSWFARGLGSQEGWHRVPHHCKSNTNIGVVNDK